MHASLTEEAATDEVRATLVAEQRDAVREEAVQRLYHPRECPDAHQHTNCRLQKTRAGRSACLVAETHASPPPAAATSSAGGPVTSIERPGPCTRPGGSKVQRTGSSCSSSLKKYVSARRASPRIPWTKYTARPHVKQLRHQHPNTVQGGLRSGQVQTPFGQWKVVQSASVCLEEVTRLDSNICFRVMPALLASRR